MRTSLSRSLRLTGALCSLFTLPLSLGACGSPKSVAVAAPIKLSGTITNESGQPVAGATVSDAQGNHAAQSDAAGHYSFDVATADLPGGAITVTAPDYSAMHRVVGPQTETLDVTLRSYTTAQVTLPTDDQPVTTTTERGEGVVSLIIGPDALVTASGAPATGEVTVKLTYYEPLKDTQNLPTPMVARIKQNSTGSEYYDLPLQTLGMVDVQVTQGTEELKVAPGKTLGLEQRLSPRYQSAMAQRPNDMPDPYMFYFDTQTHRWAIDGSLKYDATSGTLKAELPHLTIWNFDNFQNWMPPSYCTMENIRDGSGPDACRKPQNSSVGGCMSGTAFAPDKTPYANKPVRLWLFDNENTSAIDVTTDAKGRYCAEIGARLCIPLGDNKVDCSYTTNDVSYLVSGVDSPDDSSMQNPIPKYCQGNGGNFPAVNYVSSCGLVADPQKGVPAEDEPLSTPATAIISMGTKCDSGCAALPDVIIGKNPPKDPALPNKPPAQKCNVILKRGQACVATVDSATQTCCDTGDTCNDRVCVPIVDGA